MRNMAFLMGRDLFFLVDCVIDFLIVYYDENPNLVKNHKKIAIRYVKSWFAIAFTSSLPVDDLVAGFLPLNADTSPTASLNSFKLFEIIRSNQLLKLARIVRLRNR